MRSRRRGLTTKPARVATVFSVVAALTCVAAPAWGFTCSVSSGVMTVSLSAEERITFSRSGTAILLSSTTAEEPCGTISTVDRIDVTTINGATTNTAERVAIDLSNGPIGPGATAEASGVSEIEFNLNLGRDFDYFTALGTNGNDTFDVGYTPADTADIAMIHANLNGDDDADVHYGQDDPNYVGIAPIDQTELIGRDGDDRLNGGGSTETGGMLVSQLHLEGRGGHDTLVGGSSADFLFGDQDRATGTSSNPGNDLIVPGGNIDVVRGDAGDDTIDEGPMPSGGDRIDGGLGRDLVSYIARVATVNVTLNDGLRNDGGVGEGDELDGIEDVDGGLGDDNLGALLAEVVNNNLFGGPGTDILSGGGGDDVLDGAAGNDTLNGGNGADTLLGSTGGDTLNGGLDADLEQGDGGSDVFLQGTLANGGDGLLGGPDTDRVDYSFRSMNLSVTLDDSDNDGASGEGDNVATDVENVTGGGADDTIVGSAGPNELHGGEGGDTLAGADGNDTLAGGLGNDTFDEGSQPNGADEMSGGDGSDTVDYSARSGEVNATFDDTADDGEEGEGDNLLLDIEDALLPITACPGFESDPRNQIVGTPASETLTGTTGPDIICGLGGNDRLEGGADDDVLLGGIGIDALSGSGGTDRLDGGTGRDSLTGGAGPDTLIGGLHGDTATYGGSPTGVTVNLSTTPGTGSGGDAQGDSLSGIENLWGTGHIDSLTGSTAANTIRGFGSGDTLKGLGGTDTLDYTTSIAGVTVDLRTSPATVTGGHAEGDVVSLFERVVGSSFADVLQGNNLANWLTGAAGNDSLFGYGGNDRLMGQAGTDSFDGGPGTDFCDEVAGESHVNCE